MSSGLYTLYDYVDSPTFLAHLPALQWLQFLCFWRLQLDVDFSVPAFSVFTFSPYPISYNKPLSHRCGLVGADNDRRLWWTMLCERSRTLLTLATCWSSWHVAALSLRALAAKRRHRQRLSVSQRSAAMFLSRMKYAVNFAYLMAAKFYLLLCSCSYIS